ncbi:MAG: DUF2256 domain-containing protein [Pseudomonadales bacterium]
MAHKKPNLPHKICVVCQKPFAWRKKWARDWEQVKYCSERCKRQRPGDGVKP